MTQFSAKWNPAKGEKKRAIAQRGLLPSEEVWFLGVCNNLSPLASEIALTPLRLLVMLNHEIKFEAAYSDISDLQSDPKKETVRVTTADARSMLIKMVPKADIPVIEHYVQFGQANAPDPQLVAEAEAASAATAEASLKIAAAKAVDWPHTIVKGKLSQKASEAILRQCHGDEQPWLILTSSGGAGTLVGFDDRMAIIKTGALTSFMAGSLGGERSATFHFTDITGIEYNSGFMNGVLEVLTPSYSGTANRDYWTGVSASRNADSNNPWTPSNTLPLAKLEYTQYLAEINELKSRISKSKQQSVQVVVAPAAANGLADQLAKLAELRDSGVLSDEEFGAAKTRLLSS